MRFREKIFLSTLIAILVLLALLIPYATFSIRSLVEKAMGDRATEIIEKITTASDDATLVTRLKDQKAIIFFRVSLMNEKREVLYDSHVKRMLGPAFSTAFVVQHPEVLEALRTGKAYTEGYSRLFDQEFSYYAQRFDFQGKPYILRIAFPYQYIQEVITDIDKNILVIGLLGFLLFSSLAWFIIHRLTRPIQQIIAAIRPYHEGKIASLPTITLQGATPTDDFSRLATTLNRLSEKVESQIGTLKSERKEKESLLETLTEGVIALDAHQKTLYTNPAARSLLGTNTLTHPELLALVRRCNHEQETCVEPVTLETPGERLFLDAVATPYAAQGGTLLILQDKTAHYKIIEMRKDFIANASHELKTPIAIVQGFAETLRDTPLLPTEKVEQITEKIVRNCHRMHHLVMDLLTLADIENLPPSRLESIDVVALGEQAIEHVQTAHPEAYITLDAPEETLPLQGDSRLLDLAVTNLLENGVKYSEKPAHVTLQIKKMGRELILTITDQGMGIPPDDLPHIFQRFYRVDKARSRKMGGSGLGLSIVETIVRKHQGTIAVTSTLGEGTRFTLRFPL